jgi:uncharacterized protein YecT (DUF1311 family)
MIIGPSWFRAACPLIFAASALACDRGKPVRTRDDVTADSALAADLALANRDTTVVDSMGTYRAPKGAQQPDTGMITIKSPTAASTRPVAGARATPPTVSAASPPRTSAPVVSAPPASPPRTPAPVVSAPVVSAPPASPPRTRAGAAPCDSPVKADQERCVRVTLAAADARLNRVYRALITETRRREGTTTAASDSASVERLRVAQRAWLVYRDTECRRRGQGTEGPLWARARVQCLGEFSEQRANELADQFSKLTSH